MENPSPAVAYFILGKRLGALSATGGVTPESEVFIKAVGALFSELIELLFSFPLYRLYRTKKWRHVVEVNRTVYTLARQFIDKKIAEIEEEDRKSLEAASGEEEAPEKVDFITYLVHSGKMSPEEVSVSVVDLLSAGVETVNTSTYLHYVCQHHTFTDLIHSGLGALSPGQQSGGPGEAEE